MEVSKEYISKLIGIIEEQKAINNDLLRIIQKQDLKIKKLENQVNDYKTAYESLLVEVKELRVKVLEIDNLKAENQALKRENKKLKAELAKNSNNSSKPPSSNKLGARHRNKNKKSKNKVGGQKGHSGNNLKKEELADETGLYCKGKLHYGYVFSNNNLTYFDINKSRGSKALNEIGILTKL